MKITSLILSHYKERQDNLPIVIHSLRNGTRPPNKIIIFIDNPEIQFSDPTVQVIRSDERMPVVTRYALGLVCDTDYLLFLDDDLAVGKNTLRHLVKNIPQDDRFILGFEGNILNKSSDFPYTMGVNLDRNQYTLETDILIRTYFTTPLICSIVFFTKEAMKNQLPKDSIDDIILCLGNKKYGGRNIKLGIDDDSDVIELDNGKRGQCLSEFHYFNRNTACKLLI